MSSQSTTGCQDDRWRGDHGFVRQTQRAAEAAITLRPVFAKTHVNLALGLGDAILMARYLPAFKARGGGELPGAGRW